MWLFIVFVFLLYFFSTEKHAATYRVHMLSQLSSFLASKTGEASDAQAFHRGIDLHLHCLSPSWTCVRTCFSCCPLPETTSKLLHFIKRKSQERTHENKHNLIAMASNLISQKWFIFGLSIEASGDALPQELAVVVDVSLSMANQLDLVKASTDRELLSFTSMSPVHSQRLASFPSHMG